MMYFGEAVRAAREYRGITQQQLADACGVTRPHITQIEQGKYHPSLAVALQIAYALDVTLDFLTSDYYAHRRKHERTILSQPEKAP